MYKYAYLFETIQLVPIPISLPLFIPFRSKYISIALDELSTKK